MKLQKYSFGLLFLSLVMAQEASTDTSMTDIPADTLNVVETVTDTTQADSAMVDSIDVVADTLESSQTETPEVAEQEQTIPDLSPPDSIPVEWLGLEYGYKGYAWGSGNSQLPQYTYMESYSYNADSTQLVMKGELGEHNVTMVYSYSDSGFWKVEIDYMIDQSDLDKQIDQFYAIEKSLFEVYHKPKSTNQVISGPKSGIRALDKLTYERAYLHTSWKEIPCQIELILLGAVQSPKTDLSIISAPTSFLRLIYYNPDYMINPMLDMEPEQLPSIFDLY